MPSRFILAIDAGTTGNRAILFDRDMRAVRRAYRELPVSFPRPGWVEQDPGEIRDGCIAVAREVLSDVSPSDVAAIGITNQRETVVVWDRESGTPLSPAIVWQDRRTAEFCRTLDSAMLRRRTGLPADPYFSASKLRWIREHVDLPETAIAGTVDSWVLWNLTGGRRHTTDASNASRTLLFDLSTGAWDAGLCALFDVPPAMLPGITASGGDLGASDPKLFGAEIPVCAAIGDQQAALFGQACFRPGDAKATFGTGLFLVCNAGDAIPASDALLSTVAWRIGGRTVYALEGSAFVAGAAVQWLRDGLGILETAAESEAAAESVADNGGVYFVPALSGLGTPYWDAAARGLFIGLTRGTGRAHLVRATLEAIAYQTRQLVELLGATLGVSVPELRVDGGATENGFLMRHLADVLGVPVARPEMAELTAAGAAGIAGVAAGFWRSPEDFAERLGKPHVFEPSGASRETEYGLWKDAVERSRAWAP
ncbi:MAG TPA: glycerol kinase GlpK [Thermoanaerobaculia bacterium]|nr:glycerol kinase GlpK [Thermoanaerobaculia bacterium]